MPEQSRFANTFLDKGRDLGQKLGFDRPRTPRNPDCERPAAAASLHADPLILAGGAVSGSLSEPRGPEPGLR